VFIQEKGTRNLVPVRHKETGEPLRINLPLAEMKKRQQENLQKRAEKVESFINESIDGFKKGVFDTLGRPFGASNLVGE
jgi:hypothetical protein